MNGIDGETGEPLPPVTLEHLAALARGESIPAEHVADAQFWRRQGGKGLRSGDPRKLGEAGWGVIFAQDDPQADAIYEALEDLLELRRSQMGLREHYYREYRGAKGYRAQETKRKFLSRFGVGPGAADPEFMPYYLLLVGDPETIPYEFQYQLDMQYAVGRIWFETIEEYKRYAQNVVAAEKSPKSGARSTAFFAPQHPEDAATELSATRLAAPLVRLAAEKRPDWTIHTAIGTDAMKDRLRGFLGGGETPDFLFTAGHGMVYANGHPRQLTHQGALMCQDWPGSHQWHERIPPEFFFSGDDVNGACLSGLISFHFACFSAGMPACSDFSPQKRVQAAPKPFVARLPRRLLQAGALAVVGHVDTAWPCSIEWPGAGAHIHAFEDALDRLLSGHPVGSAMEPFGVRFADLSSDLSSSLEEEKQGGKVDDQELAELWMNSHDTRNYIVLGDPAVRLVQPEAKP
jgi:hypothetical protein